MSMSDVRSEIHLTPNEWAIILTAHRSGNDKLEAAWLEAVARTFHVFCDKQVDYGDENIREMGEKGVLQRIKEKVVRAQNLLRTGTAPRNEPIEDSYIDIADYGLIALLVHDGNWPPAPGPPKSIDVCGTCGQEIRKEK